ARQSVRRACAGLQAHRDGAEDHRRRLRRRQDRGGDDISLKFESAVQKDLPRLVELLGILFESEAEFSADAEKQRAALQAILSDPGKGKIYVARDGRLVVAMASLLYTISTAEGGKA